MGELQGTEADKMMLWIKWRKWNVLSLLVWSTYIESWGTGWLSSPNPSEKLPFLWKHPYTHLQLACYEGKVTLSWNLSSVVNSSWDLGEIFPLWPHHSSLKLPADLAIINASGFSYFPISLKSHLWGFSHNPLLLFSAWPRLVLRALPSFPHAFPQRARGAFCNVITSLLFHRKG